MRKMKNSGVEWIGDIPENWEVVKLSRFSKFINGYAFKSDELNSSVGLNVIRIGDIKHNGIDFENCLKYSYKSEKHKEFYIKHKDILIAMSGATTGKNCYAEMTGIDACINQRVGIIRSLESSRFIYYTLNTVAFYQYIELLSKGSAQPNISGYEILSFKCSFPTLSQQQKIANYLDNKTKLIDKTIELTNEQIDKLKEYKQALITETVTKGLDKNVKMKDSGVEWIGKIPECWQLVRLKNVITTRSEKTTNTSYNYIGLENVESKTGRFLKTEKVEYSGANSFTKADDILFGKLRPYLSKVLIVSEDSVCSSEFLVISKFEGIKAYIKYLFLSSWFIKVVDNSTYGTKMPRANSEFILNMQITIPPLTEQQGIATYLDNKVDKIDKTIKEKQNLIKKLEEYKKSLIYECITGKKEII